MASYVESSELQHMGETIITQHYPQLIPLFASIAWVFSDLADMVQGRILSGHTYHESARQWTLHGKDFTVCIGRDVWVKAEPEFQFALLDHQIAFMGLSYVPDPSDPEAEHIPEKDENGRFRTRILKPDVMEFTPVVERHGAYFASLRVFLVRFAEGRKKEAAEKRAEGKRAAKRTREGPEMGSEEFIERATCGDPSLEV